MTPDLSSRQSFCEQTVLRAQLHPGAIVLDVGSGEGHSAVAAAGAVGPGGRVIGLEVSPEQIVVARGLAASLSNVEFRHANFDQVYFRNGSFDAIVCCFGLHLFPDLRTTLQKMRRLLRPGGRLAVAAPDPAAFELVREVFGAAELSGAAPCFCVVAVKTS